MKIEILDDDEETGFDVKDAHIYVEELNLLNIYLPSFDIIEVKPNEN